jgi:hypothetical protein
MLLTKHFCGRRALTATINDHAEWLSQRDVVRDAYREEGVICKHGPAPRHHGIYRVADGMDDRPTVTRADPLTHSGMGGNFAVEAHRILPGHQWSMLLYPQKKRRELEANALIRRGNLPALDPGGAQRILGTAAHAWIRVTHHKKHA